jgi:hypothetical protein
MKNKKIFPFMMFTVISALILSFIYSCTMNPSSGKSNSNNSSVSSSSISSSAQSSAGSSLNFDQVITFQDPSFESLIRALINKPSNKIYGRDLSNITSIDLMEKGISNIQNMHGIEYCVNLSALTCSKNQLTVLDVTKNTNLTLLLCDNNNLAALDVTKNTKLSILWCGNNQLTTLDVSKNVKLDVLICFFNRLNSGVIDDILSNMYVNISNYNNITNFDIWLHGQNPAAPPSSIGSNYLIMLRNNYKRRVFTD